MNNLVKFAIEQLYYSSCSEREMRNILLEKFRNNPQAQKLLDISMDYLKTNGLINDWQLAERLAMNYTHKGNRFIFKLLNQRKIDPSVIADVISKLPAERTRALHEALRKIKSLSCKEDARFVLIRFLNGRLFSGAAIKEALQQVFSQKNLKHDFA